MAQTAAATNTAALVASLLETGDDPADAARLDALDTTRRAGESSGEPVSRFCKLSQRAL